MELVVFNKYLYVLGPRSKISTCAHARAHGLQKSCARANYSAERFAERALSPSMKISMSVGQ
jgi:hypothetical protein